MSGSVAVIGGGVTGMVAALDLADLGYRVYLIENKPSIGGVMSQLDKTFPTLDCSMCTLAPRMVEVARHANIELMTYSEVERLDGQEGDFRLTVRRKARFVDEAKCTGCCDCVPVCPVALPNEFDMGMSDRKAIYLPFQQAVPSVATIDREGIAPCTNACPGGLSAQGYVALIREGKLEEAINLIRGTVPLPSVCGRICHHPCEEACNRGEVDAPVAISALKSFVGDCIRNQDEDTPPEVPQRREEKVAVVGGGPAGLTAAYRLALMGFGVKMFEASTQPGGMLWWGIPEYRLPKEVLKADVDYLLKAGIEIDYGITVGKDVTLEQLHEDYNAVFVAIGAHKSQELGIEGEDLEGVIHGIEFLRSVAGGEKLQLGKKVAVIGGGNVAIDAVRSALRLGSEALLLYRRTREEMPAIESEITAAEEEGVEINYLVSPVRIVGEGGKVKAIECVKMELGEPDESGRRRPVPIKGSEFSIKVDTVIPAIGQAPDIETLQSGDLGVTKWGTIEVEPGNMCTTIPGVFAGGDAVLGPASAIEAMATGNKAAKYIERYLNGDSIEPDPQEPEPHVISLEDVRARMKGEITLQERVSRETLPLEKQRTSFEEVERAFTAEEAIAEATRCLNCGPCSMCSQCVIACEREAINYDMKDQVLELEVGAIVVATGFEPMDAAALKEYGWGALPNVITTLQLERLLNASGPTDGQVLLDDGSHPRHVAFLLCAGSRDEKRSPYCSRVCCMYAVKEAILVREHDPSVECTIFYIDIRAFGKNQEEFFTRARDEFGIKFIRNKPSNVMRNGDRLRIKYEDTETGEAKTLEVDMVTLATAMVPTAGVAERLSLETDAYGFLRSGEHPVMSSRPGVFIAGAAEGPRDISDSVAMASAAAAHVSAALHLYRGTEVTPQEVPEERDVSGQEPRIGVFICHCGSNIAGIVDVETVTEYTANLPGVVYATHPMYTCSEENQQEMQQAIEEHNLNRVIVASCTPRTHEPLFRETCRQAGLNPYLFEMANIREMDSWVHTDREVATEKARDLVRMAVSRARLLEPQQKQTVTVTPSAIVIGAGPAGLTSALSIAEQGFQAHIVERGEPGGMLNEMESAFGPWQPAELRDKLVKAAENHPMVSMHRGEIQEINGYMGNFEATLSDGSRVPAGAVIVATGAQEWKPDKYGYGGEGIHTQLELQGIIDRGEITDTEKIVMIQCVGSREEEGERTYCSRVCCVEALKNAIEIRERWPDTKVNIVYRDIRSYSRYEELYGKARELGVWFFRYTQESEPQVSGTTVRVRDTLLGDDVIIHADRVILSSATIPNPGTEELASMLKCPVGQDGFFLEAHLKLRPLDFTNDGLFLAGTAAGPKDLTDTLISAAGAAARACRILSNDEMEVEATTTVIMESLCIGCGRCEKVCPYGAITLSGKPNDIKSSVNPALCKSCGACAAECPTGAARARHFTTDQIVDMIDAWGGL